MSNPSAFGSPALPLSEKESGVVNVSLMDASGPFPTQLEVIRMVKITFYDSDEEIWDNLSKAMKIADERVT